MRAYFSLIKFSHTIFALPFAIAGYFLGIKEVNLSFQLQTFLLVILCMVFARTAAMAFNRYLDRDIDAANVRTSAREIPAGVIKPKNARFFVVVNSLLFIATTWFINTICFYLSPVALLVILGYSYTKRFTWMCHLVLGIGLGLAPVGAWLAVTGSFDIIPILLGGLVLFWVAGFDVIYALQDAAFDKSQHLYSIPVVAGKAGALKISRFLHFFSALFAFLLGVYMEAGWVYFLGAFFFLGLLIYQQVLVKPSDLSKVNLAFFTTNGVAGVVFLLFILADIWRLLR